MADRNRAYDIRSVAKLIEVVNRGDDAADANRDLAAVIETLSARHETYGGQHKGKLVLTVDMVVTKEGRLNVSLSSEAKIPKRPVSTEQLFIADDGTLTAMDPARDSLFAGQNLGRSPEITRTASAAE